MSKDWKGKRLMTDKERYWHYERVLIEIKEAFESKKKRVNMPNGMSVQAFISCALQDIWKDTEMIESEGL